MKKNLQNRFINYNFAFQSTFIMKLIRDYFILGFAFLFFIGMKFWYKNAETQDVDFILRPTNLMVELLTGSEAIYSAERGFFHSKWNISIEKSCSGFNFIMLCFLMFSFYILPKIENKIKQIIAFPMMIFVAWFLTVFVNSSRILLALKTKNIDFSFTGQNPAAIHEMQGILVYLTYLIVFYLTMIYIFQKYFSTSK
jgi:exosortase K